MKFKFRTIIYILSSIISLTLLSAVGYFLKVGNILADLGDINYFDLLTSQIANTLIVLSLTSVLSLNFGQVYWVDIKETKLIIPFWGCFIGITLYLLTGLVYSIVCYSFKINIGVIVSALFSTILLVILTFKMISIYFGKEELKKQLKFEYKKLLILNQASYIDDYIRKMETFEKSVKEDFSYKGKLIRQLHKEIVKTKSKLENSEMVDEIHKNHIDKHIEGIEKLKNIDIKLIEYTKNAIDNNDSEVVYDNVDLLIESENYDTFFNVLEELFDWDEKYTCKKLKEISKKNTAWMVKDRLLFFKKYALQNLITESGKLDAIQNLLLVYDPNNDGMQKISQKVRIVTDDIDELKKEMLKLDNELNSDEDYRKTRALQEEARNEIKIKREELKNKLGDILSSAQTKEIRSFYIPIKEACIAYDEGRYEIVNKYITVIITNFEQDIKTIYSLSGICEISTLFDFNFSYVTDEERFLINQLIEKDKDRMVLSEKDKTQIAKLDNVTISNNPKSYMDADFFDVIKSVLKTDNA
ncbi:MAG: hypothetical protein GX284_02770 [Clostridiales bacterium]|nr:hypothetical protein [Clostridiales bacterium]